MISLFMKHKLKNYLMINHPEALCLILSLKERAGILKSGNKSTDEIALSLPQVVQYGPFR